MVKGDLSTQTHVPESQLPVKMRVLAKHLLARPTGDKKV